MKVSVLSSPARFFLVLVLAAFTSIGFVLSFTREDFPSDFIFGSATSANQVEGATFEDGRTASLFDTYFHNDADSGYTMDVMCDQYHKYKDDVQLMVQTGLDAYRFSISWSRLIPYGRGPINPKGVEYYNNLINELIKYGIQPHVTLLHLDLPLQLEENYTSQGWQDQQFVEDFTKYADVCFKLFGDRVLHWTTINEPNCYSSILSAKTPKVINVAHKLLIGHASVANLYREKYKATQNGLVGLNICASWYLPDGDNEEDLIATQRVNKLIGWFIDPLLFGDYSDFMKHLLGNELPLITKQESELLIKGSFDFIGLNIYQAIGVKDTPTKGNLAATCSSKQVGGKFIQGVLEYFKQVYGNPPIYIQETGLRTFHNTSLEDSSRVDYLSACIESLYEAIRTSHDRLAQPLMHINYFKF
ncbi:unnamed protein product [Amaranthus hypochondriacus]